MEQVTQLVLPTMIEYNMCTQYKVPMMNVSNLDLNKIIHKKNSTIGGSAEATVTAYFDQLEATIIKYIDASQYVIGCAAWLTNHNIIEALTKIKGVKIVINKEEYLNSKIITSNNFFYTKLREKYDNISDMFGLPCECCNTNVGTETIHVRACKSKCACTHNAPIVRLNSCSTFTKFSNGQIRQKPGAILTCGIVNSPSKMHHKFLIFFDDKFETLGVWTGSYNFSSNSNSCIENGLYIRDKGTIQSYIDEFFLIYEFAEPYNWQSGLMNVDKR